MKNRKILLSLTAMLFLASCNNSNISKIDFAGYTEDVYSELTSLSIGVGETYQLDKMLFDSIDYTNVKLTIDNSKLAELGENYSITGLKEGSTNIYFYDETTKIRHTIPLSVLSDKDLRKSFKIEKGRFSGKTITFIGDSITQYWGNDIYYVKLLSDALEASYFNYGVSGTTAAHSEVREVNGFRNIGPDYVNNAITNNEIGDYAFILYGTNDWSGYVKMGSIDDYEEDTSKIDTFYGGLNYMVSKIQETNPNTKIIMMSCLFRNMIFDENPNNLGEEHTLEEYNLAIQKIAEKYGTKFIDLWKLFDETTLVRNFNDGLHPNETGHRAITEYILKQ